MPFQSEAQRRLMWAQHPDIAQRWVDEGARSKGLPYHKRGKQRLSNRKTKRRGNRASRRH